MLSNTTGYIGRCASGFRSLITLLQGFCCQYQLIRHLKVEFDLPMMCCQEEGKEVHGEGGLSIPGDGALRAKYFGMSFERHFAMPEC